MALFSASSLHRIALESCRAARILRRSVAHAPRVLFGCGFAALCLREAIAQILRAPRRFASPCRGAMNRARVRAGGLRAFRSRDFGGTALPARCFSRRVRAIFSRSSLRLRDSAIQSPHHIRFPLACAAFLLASSVGCLAQDATNLLQNGGFEQVTGERAAGWEPYEAGYVPDSAVRHSGTSSLRCVNTRSDEGRGAMYMLTLNQKRPTPLLVSGWSRAENVSGTVNSDYAIYVDLELADGTPLWGQTAPFGTGTHDWQHRQVLIASTKPIRSARIYALFRNHAGTAWFDDFAAAELSGTHMFDSQALAAPRLPPGVDRAWFVRDVAAGSALRLLYAERPPTTARP